MKEEEDEGREADECARNTLMPDTRNIGTAFSLFRVRLLLVTIYVVFTVDLC